AEDGDRRPDLVERVKPLDELGKDAQYPPRIGVVAELFDRAALEQRSVGRGLLARDDKATGAASVTDLPPSGVARQVGGFDSSRGGVSSPFMGRWPFPPHPWGGVGEADDRAGSAGDGRSAGVATCSASESGNNH